MSLISVKNLGKRFGDSVVFQNVTAEVKKGEVVTIIGPSGAGKSLFLRAINFLDPPTDGEVFFDGERVTLSNMDSVRRRMVMVFQNFGLFRHMDVIGNIMAGQTNLLNKSKAEAEENSLKILKSVGLSDRARYYPHQLSGGQKQRVAIARCLAMSPDVILFDEPTSALDPTMTSEVTTVMRGLAKSGMTMLVVTHEISLALEISHRVFYMDEGGIYEQNSPYELFNYPQRPKTQAFINNISSFNYKIESRDFDYAEMLGGVEGFCFRNHVDRYTANKLYLLVEELVVNIITPKFGECSVTLSFSNEAGAYALDVSYGGKNIDALLHTEDALAAAMVRATAKTLRHEFAEGRNRITAAL